MWFLIRQLLHVCPRSIFKTKKAESSMLLIVLVYILQRRCNTQYKTDISYTAALQWTTEFTSVVWENSFSVSMILLTCVVNLCLGDCMKSIDYLTFISCNIFQWFWNRRCQRYLFSVWIFYYIKTLMVNERKNYMIKWRF